MHIATDPFSHHPELRGMIAVPSTSFFRNFSADSILKSHPELSGLRDWVYADQAREDIRARCLAEHTSGDLWIFGYGSLMWDPALHFTEVRRAHVPDHSRRFILVDRNGGRGTQEQPGLMAALDQGDGCDGLMFRIAAKDIDTETEILWRREIIGPGYLPRFVIAQIDGQPQTALTFVADYDAETIDPSISRADQIRMIAQSAGFLGTSKAYLQNIVTQFAHLGIVDADCSALLQEVEDFIANPKLSVT